MKPISLNVVSSYGIEASISCEGSQGGHEDYFSIVSVQGYITEKKIYGIDPLQSFSLGWALIQQLTLDKRISDDTEIGVRGASWRIESA